MTQTLTKKDSTRKMLRSVRRHLRLTRRTGNETAQTLAERIAEPAEQLKAADDAAQSQRTAADDAFDDWNQDDGRLDRAVQAAHRRSVDYDAEHPGQTSTQLLFGGRPASQITSAPRGQEPDLVAKIVARGASLPAEHPAAALLPALTGLAEASRKAHRAWVDALQRAAAADAAVEVARVALVRAYRDNAIDLARALGDAFAQDCFPRLRSSHTAASEDDDSAAASAASE